MKKLIVLLCVTLSLTNLSFFSVGKAEFTLFHAIVLLVLFFYFFIGLKNKKFLVQSPKHAIIAGIYLCLVNMVYIRQIKTTSFVYSLVIFIELFLLFNCVEKLDTATIRRIFRTVIILYFLNIFVATVFILLKFFPEGILGNIFQIYVFDNRIRPFGFSNEPSYASIILVFCLYVLFKSVGFKYRKDDLGIYLIAIVSIILTGSSYGYMLLAILLFYFVVKSNIILYQLSVIIKSKVLSRIELIITFALLIFGIVIFVQNVDFSHNRSINRLVTIYTSLTTSEDDNAGKIENISKIDGSASMRFVPTLYMIKDFCESSPHNVLFGRGAGQSVEFFSKIYEGHQTSLGFAPAFIYNYGIVGTILFLMMFFKLFPRKKVIPVLFFILFIFNADFNTQIFLFVLFSIMASRQIEENDLKPLAP